MGSFFIALGSMALGGWVFFTAPAAARAQSGMQLFDREGDKSRRLRGNLTLWGCRLGGLVAFLVGLMGIVELLSRGVPA